MTTKEFLKPIVVLTTICFVTVAALAFTYQFTKPYIDAAELASSAEAMKEVFVGEYTFEKYDLTGMELENIEVAASVKSSGGEVAGYVITAATKGYDGKFNVMVGIDTAGAITGVKVLENSETPGIGSKATLPEYLEQYKGKTVSEPDLISGATISSTAVKNAVQSALDAYVKIAEGGEGK